MDEQDERHTSDAALRDVTSASRLLDLALDSMAGHHYFEAFDHLDDAERLIRWAKGNVRYLRNGEEVPA